jgi:hypothetical protein
MRRDSVNPKDWVIGLYFWDNTFAVQLEPTCLGLDDDALPRPYDWLSMSIDELRIQTGGEDEGDREKEIENLTRFINRLIAARNELEGK